MTANVFLLAADNSPELLPLLRSEPDLARSQDEHGYTLLHAATSYSHAELLRTLLGEFKLDVNVLDEDGETPLFVAETEEIAKILVEEFSADLLISNEEGQTAYAKIVEEDEFPEVAAYLKKIAVERGLTFPSSEEQTSETTTSSSISATGNLPPGVAVKVAQVAENEDLPEADPEFRRRIEELAQRSDLGSEEATKEMRKIVEDALFSSSN